MNNFPLAASQSLKTFICLHACFVLLLGSLMAEDAIPSTHAGTWERTEVINAKTGQGERAGRRFFLVWKPTGEMIWVGLSSQVPATRAVKNGSELFDRTPKGDVRVGTATVDGSKLRLIFDKPGLISSGFVRVSNSIDPAAVPKVPGRN